MLAPAIAMTVALVAGIGAVDRSRYRHRPTAAAKPGAPAPAFSAPDIAGRTVGLGDYAGKIVILEWTNDGCPFVGKHYDSGNMQALQRKYTGEWRCLADHRLLGARRAGLCDARRSKGRSRAVAGGTRAISCSTPTASSAVSTTRGRRRTWW